jgi:hypothetical protein
VPFAAPSLPESKEDYHADDVDDRDDVFSDWPRTELAPSSMTNTIILGAAAALGEDNDHVRSVRRARQDIYWLLLQLSIQRMPGYLVNEYCSVYH